MNYADRVCSSSMTFHKDKVNIIGMVNYIREHPNIRYLTIHSCKIVDPNNIVEYFAMLKDSGISSFSLYDSGAHCGLYAVVFVYNNFKRLRKISLTGGGIDAGIAKVLANGYLTNISDLTLNSQTIGDQGAEFLANGNLLSLTRLELTRNGIGDYGAIALANGNLANISALLLGENRIRDQGAKALANGNLTNLISLELNNNAITNDGSVALANGNLKRLEYLNLHTNDISPDGAMAIAHGNLLNLKNLKLWGFKDYNEIDLALVAIIAYRRKQIWSKLEQTSSTE